VTQFEILLADDVDPDAKSAQIDQMFHGGPVETDTRPKGVFQARSLGDLAELIAMAHYLSYACVGLVLALVATTTVMSVQDRIREHALLQTIGFSGLRVFSLVVIESAVLGISGGVIGVGLAMTMLKWSALSVGAEAVTIAFTPSLHLALWGILIATVSGLVAGCLPGWLAARAEIVSALRSV
jgi:putative ABC transport system permease protein